MKSGPNKFSGSVLLAVSGGIDSVVMAHMLSKQARRPEERIAIAHCNFHLRGEESDGDAAFVREYASSLGLEFFSKDFDTAGFASENRLSIETAARKLRYEWFDRLCREHSFDAVCVAHNANDNAETLILNLLRGTGLKGACAMSEVSDNAYSSNPQEPTKVYRPLLELGRAEIEAYAAEHGLKFRIDSTNLENDCRRNIVRNEIFPLLAGINPSFVETLNRDIRNFRQAYERLQGQENHYELASMMAEKGFNASTIEDVMRLLRSGKPVGGKRFYAPAYVLVGRGDSLQFEERGELCSRRAKVSLVDWKSGMNPRTGKGVSIIDAEALWKLFPAWDFGPDTCNLPIRKKKDGDWLKLSGLNGRKKVNDLLAAEGYDLKAKSEALVLGSDGPHVYAVLGVRPDAALMVNEHTTKVYIIEIE